MFDLILKRNNIDFYLINSNQYHIIYIYSSVKNCGFFFMLNTFIFYSDSLNYLQTTTFNIKNIKKIKLFIFAWNNFFTKKIKVRHKVSWLKLFRNKYYIMRINYGFSYNVIFILTKIYFRKKKKIIKHSNILLWGVNPNYLFNLAKSIVNIQPVNCYTLRGFKFSKQRFRKKVGKISKYMDFKKKLL